MTRPHTLSPLPPTTALGSVVSKFSSGSKYRLPQAAGANTHTLFHIATITKG